MVIINAVDCNERSTVLNVTSSYLDSKDVHQVFTDNINLYNDIINKYGIDKCTYNEHLVALWLQIVEGSMLVISDIKNEMSSVYDDLLNNYSIISISN